MEKISLNDYRDYYNRASSIRHYYDVGVEVFQITRHRYKRIEGNISTACGKGMDLDIALVTALGELIERDAVEYLDNDPTIYTMDGHKAGVIPKEFVQIPNKDRYWTSDGCAAHTRLEDAVLNGIFELVERSYIYTVPYSEYKYIERSKLVAHVGERTIDRIEALGDEIYPLVYKSKTNGLYISRIIIWDKIGSTQDSLVEGYGCNPDLGSALRSAMLEAIQSKCVIISGGREDLQYKRHELDKITIDRELFQLTLNPIENYRNEDYLVNEIVQRIEEEFGSPMYYAYLGKSNDYHVIRAMIDGSIHKSLNGTLYRYQLHM